MPSQYIYDMSDTWNSGITTYTAVKMNVTDAASAADSLLMDLQIGGASKFKIDKNGSATLVSSDAGAGAGPVLTFWRDSASPAASDILGKILFQGEDNGGNAEDYAEIYAQIVDPAAGSEDASLYLRAKIAGTMTTIATLSSGGLTLNTPLAVSQGGTGAATASAARSNLGLGSAGPLSNRNKIINGNFDIWQRGTSGTSGYVADRWGTLLSGSTAAISRQSFTLGQTDVPNEPTYFHRVAVTSSAGSGNYAILYHKIEDVRTFAGQTATLSFWAKADASKNIAIEFLQYFGSGGSPSSSVSGVGVTTCALTTSWQKFTVMVSVPSISGKTVGTNINSSTFEVLFWLDAGSNHNARTNSLGQQSGTFDIAQVQLEAGSSATPFEHRSYGQELALCQRYYQKLGGVAYSPIGFGINISLTETRAVYVKYHAVMRCPPSISIEGTLIATDRTNYDADITSILASSIGDGSCTLSLSHGSHGTSGYPEQVAVKSNTTSYFVLDAEL